MAIFKKSKSETPASMSSDTEKGSPTGPVNVPKSVPATTLEAAVQVAALLYHRDGAEPGGDYLLRKCGQVHVDAVRESGGDPAAVAEWACAEARRRSPAMNHKAIVAQRIA